jgi:SRF-type transcription factor (DNA-binding and dimerisation domain)
MVTNNCKRRTDNVGRRKKTLLKKAHKLGKYDGVDVAVIIRQNGKFFTYRSVDHKSWSLVYGGDCKTMSS